MIPPPAEDRELLRQVSKGNEAAFAALYERFHENVYRFALHMSANAATAEEVTQEVFLQVIRKAKGYDAEKGPLAAYLVGIARNLLRRRLQEHRDVPLPEDAEEWLENGPEVESEIIAQMDLREMLICLQKAVGALPEQYREAVVLCEMEEMSYAEAALILDCAPGTVASRLNRARRMLKARLGKQGCVR
jgi:RNA polymerase sigma-70 factor, ECF subfamily